MVSGATGAQAAIAVQLMDVKIFFVPTGDVRRKLET
jgi:hypothetical protein